MAKTREQRTKEVSLPEKFVPQFWDAVDGRFGVVKEIRRRYEVLKQDAAAESYQKDLLCQRAIFLGVQLETLEAVAVAEGKFDAGIYTQMVNALSGLLSKLGLERQIPKAKNLKAYMKERDSA